jgi:hypothetical protein
MICFTAAHLAVFVESIVLKATNAAVGTLDTLAVRGQGEQKEEEHKHDVSVPDTP